MMYLVKRLVSGVLGIGLDKAKDYGPREGEVKA